MNRRGFFGVCAGVAAVANTALPAMARLEPIAAVVPTEDDIRITTCDLCGESFLDDNGFDEANCRGFYISESECGLIVCEHCVPEYLTGE